MGMDARTAAARFLDSPALAEGTRRAYRVDVRAFLRHALGAARVPNARVAPRRVRRLPETTRSADLDKELAALEGEGPLHLRNRALVELVYSAGLRSAEAVGLDLADVDFENETVHVRGKGGKERVVPLGEEAAAWTCLLYTSDAADEEDSVDLGGRRIIK